MAWAEPKHPLLEPAWPIGSKKLSNNLTLLHYPPLSQVGGASGVSLSAGQSQLVCVARCLLSGAPLVLLDEATAAVDPKTAALLHQVSKG